MIRTILLALTVMRAHAGEPCPFLDRMESPGLKNASWALSVRDPATDEELVSCSASSNLVPASALKLFVTAAAMDLIGPETRFRTRVYAKGRVSGGVLDGDVYIRGGGDPSFASRLIKGAPEAGAAFGEWTRALKKAGIGKMTGSVLADDSLFEGPPVPGSWTWEDVGNYYAAGPSALAFNDNLYRIYFRPGPREGDPAPILRVEPEVPGLDLRDLVRTAAEGSGDNVYIFNFPGHYSADVRGTVPRGPAEFPVKGALPDPALFTARAFGAHLAAHGVRADGDPGKASSPVDYGAAVLIASTEGAPLKDIVFATNKRSFNLYAETLLRHLALAEGKPGTAENGLAVLRGYMAGNGMDVSELRLADASGLSRLNMVQAGEFTRFLGRISSKPFFGLYRGSLVRPGDPDATGHVRGLGAGSRLAGRLRIKTGSLSGVRAYAGYLVTDKGRLLTFASLVNNYSVPASGIDDIHEAMLLELAGKY